MKILSSIAAASLLVFVWGFVSWMVLPWHKTEGRPFQDPEAVAAVLKANAPVRGIYALPVADQEEMEIGMLAKADGPWMYGVVRPGPAPVESFLVLLIRSFLIQAAGCGLLAALILVSGVSSWSRRLILCAIAGLFAGIVGALPLWSWFEWPGSATLVTMLDIFIGALFAGVALAFLLPRKENADK